MERGGHRTCTSEVGTNAHMPYLYTQRNSEQSASALEMGTVCRLCGTLHFLHSLKKWHSVYLEVKNVISLQEGNTGFV